MCGTKYSDFLCILGTGKSETGAHIAYTLAMSNRMSGLDGCVLYCAPTNKAVDVVLSEFCNFTEYYDLKVIIFLKLNMGKI